MSGKRLTDDFIREEMVYPESALKNKVEGTVVLQFIVDPKGNVSNLQVIESVSPALDEEAQRIFRKIIWLPGTRLGRNVTTENTFEIRFKVRKYEKICRQRGYDRPAYPHEPVDPGFSIYEKEEVEISPRPVFSSLNRNLGEFVSENMKYPEAAFKQNISGTVELGFVVEPSGRISNIHVVNPVGGGCTEEAIRLAKMIRWHPGIRDDMAVRVFNSLSITFDIAGHSVDGTVPVPGQIH